MSFILDLLFGISKRGLLPVLILAAGWYGGAKYGAPDLVINAVDGVISRGGAMIAPLFDRSVEKGGEIVADVVEEGSDYVVGTVEGVLEDLAEPAETDEGATDEAATDDAATDESDAEAAPAADDGEDASDGAVAADTSDGEDADDAAPAADDDGADEAVAPAGDETAAAPAAATPVAAAEGDIILCKMTVSNSPSAGADGVVRAAGATVNKNGVDLLLMPATKSCLSSGYGPRNGKTHKGIDYYSDSGGDALAAGGGVIRERVTRSDYGNMVVIDHGDGVFTRYAHLASFGSGVTDGATVTAGQVLGPIGNTGASSIIHLHYEILTGEWVGAAGSFGLDSVDPFSLPAGAGV